MDRGARGPLVPAQHSAANERRQRPAVLGAMASSFRAGTTNSAAKFFVTFQPGRLRSTIGNATSSSTPAATIMPVVSATCQFHVTASDGPRKSSW